MHLLGIVCVRGLSCLGPQISARGHACAHGPSSELQGRRFSTFSSACADPDHLMASVAKRSFPKVLPLGEG